jgi:hypothetical protein
MAGDGFAVSVKLIDLATGPILKVNNALEAVEKTAKRAAREGGLFEVRDALGKMRKEAAEVADKFGEIFTPLAGLGAAGSLAGMASLAERFARVGTEVGRTSNLFGVGSRDLQTWRGAMRLAGGEAEDATRLIGGMGRQLYLARAGLNQKAVMTAAQFRLDISETDPLKFIKKAADVVKGLTAQQRRSFADGFGIDDSSLALLSQGSAAIERLNEESQRHGVLSDQQIRQAFELHHAYTGLNLAIESTSSAIGAQMGEWLTPMLKGWSEWIDKARETPAIMKSVELGVDALATVMAVSLAGSLAKVLWWSNAVWAAPLFRFLASPAGAMTGGIGAFLWGMAPSPTNQGEDEALKRGLHAPTQEEVDQYQKGLQEKPKDRTLWDRYRDWANPGGSGTAPIPSRPSAAGRMGSNSSIQHGIDFFEGKGLSREQSAGIVARLAAESGGGARLDPNAVNPTSGAYGIAQWLGSRKPAATATGGDLDRQLELVWREFQTSERSAFNAIRSTRSAYDSAVAMEQFERAGNPSFTHQAARHAERLAQSATSSPSASNSGWLSSLGRAFGVGSAHAEKPGDPTAGYTKTNSIGERYRWDESGWHLLDEQMRRRMSFNEMDDMEKIAAPKIPGTKIPDRGKSESDLLPKEDWTSRLPFPNPELLRKGGPYPEVPGSRDYMLEQVPRYRSNQRAYRLEQDANYQPAVPTVADTVGKSADLGADDTRHHVEVHFRNAPSGMRSGLTRADGPASVAVRTQYAMDGVV